MTQSMFLCSSGCACSCPIVEVSPQGANIGESGNKVTLTAGQWNLLVEK